MYGGILYVLEVYLDETPWTLPEIRQYSLVSPCATGLLRSNSAPDIFLLGLLSYFLEAITLLNDSEYF